MVLSPSRTGLLAQTFWSSPGSRAHCFLTCMGSSTTPSPAGRSRIARHASVAFPLTEKGRHSGYSFSQLNGPPASTSVYASLTPSRTTAQDSRPKWSRFSFLAGLLHPLQCAGLARHSLSTKTSCFSSRLNTTQEQIVFVKEISPGILAALRAV